MSPTWQDREKFHELGKISPGGYRLSAWRHLRRWRESLQPGRNPLEDQVPWVTFDSLRRLGALVRPGFRVLEYGLGGSTRYFLNKGCVLHSVEHDPEWFARVRGLVGEREAWTPVLVEPEPCALGGDPGCRSESAGYENLSFSRYVGVIESLADRSFDLVLVDGRARVPVALKAAAKVKPGGILILDNAERIRYRPIHQYFAREEWRQERFPGPGPYVWHEFWETCLWIRPGHSR